MFIECLKDVVPAEIFGHCREALVDGVSNARTGATKHMVLVLVLEAATWAQGICCAPADLFLLVPYVKPLVHHLGYSDGRGVKEPGLGKANRFEVYAVCVFFFIHTVPAGN